MSTDEYDLVVISASPAGQVAAELAAAFGRRALVVEQNQPGGVVTTTGGAPTKALREAALYLTGFRQQEVCGVRAAAPLEVVLPILCSRIERVRDALQLRLPRRRHRRADSPGRAAGPRRERGRPAGGHGGRGTVTRSA